MLCIFVFLLQIEKKVISDIKVNFYYLSDLDEIFDIKQLKDGECNGDNYFSNF